MEIKPIVGKNKSKIKQPENDDMPRVPFFMSICASRGSGKSNLVLNMLQNKDMFKGVFNPKDIFALSPSMDLNHDYDTVKCNKINEFDNNLILQIMDIQKKLISRNGQDKVPQILIILDDCLDAPKSFNIGSAMEKLSVRGRHLNISCIIVSQSMRRISRTIRLNTCSMIFFKPKNLSELDCFLEEYVPKRKHKEFSDKLREFFNRMEYGFILVDGQTRDDKRRFRGNFSECLELE